MAAIVIATMIVACVVLALALSFVSLPGSDSGESAESTATVSDVQTYEETTVSVLDVDQGQAVLVVTGDGSAALIDAGRSQERIREEIEPYVRSLGVSSLDYLILSHPDQDHVGGMPQVFESFDVGTWVDPGIPTTNQTYEESVEIVLERNIPAILARKGEMLSLGPSTTLTLLWPEDDFILDGSEPDSNENSAVVLVTVGDIDILITGDLEDEGEANLVEQMGAGLESEILVVGHHGSNSSSTPGFLDAVNPETAIISVGEDNPYGHPHDEVIQRLRFRDIDIYRTDLDGTIEIHVDGDSYDIDTVETDPGT
ncbi:MAG: ComEC/Rec2 family competence protein [Thermomicrobiales bacterium]